MGNGKVCPISTCSLSLQTTSIVVAVLQFVLSLSIDTTVLLVFWLTTVQRDWDWIIVLISCVVQIPLGLLLTFSASKRYLRGIVLWINATSALVTLQIVLFIVNFLIGLVGPPFFVGLGDIVFNVYAIGKVHQFKQEMATKTGPELGLGTDSSSNLAYRILGATTLDLTYSL